ncbi:MAG: DMT family transporter [Flavobacteriaceae bacterium]
MKPTSSHFFWLNVSLFFISTSGVLGRWIALPPEVSIFWRSFLALPFLLGIVLVRQYDLKRIFHWDKSIFLAGLLMGIHWVTYFYSLQWSNVAVGMLSLFTFPVITAFLEPLFFKTTFNKSHLWLGLLTLIGIFFLVPSIELAQAHGWAVLLGIFSALCYSLRNLILKKRIGTNSGSELMLFQVIIIAVCFSPFLVEHSFSESFSYAWALVFLALFTTVIGHSLFLFSLSYFSVTTASIFACLQPLYGIAIAFFLLGEAPHWGTYVGGGLILLAVVLEGRKTTN